jgi:hypothetical protein
MLKEKQETVSTYAQAERHFNKIILGSKIKNLNDFLETQTREETNEYFKKWGPQWCKYAEHLIWINNAMKKNTIKEKHYLDIVDEEMAEVEIDEKVLEGAKWLERILKMNLIHGPEFFAKFIVVREKMLNKINTFCICGPPNCGKTMFILLLTKDLEATTLPKQHDLGTFYFQKLCGPTCAIIEEPMIWTMNVNAYKTLLGGERPSTDVKNKEHEDLKRIPFFITTSEHRLGQQCHSIDQNGVSDTIVPVYVQQSNQASQLAGELLMA